MSLSYSTYQTQDFKCLLCKWEGKGKDLVSEYNPYSNILGLECPNCFGPLGHIQFPIDPSKPYDEEEDKKYW